MWWSMFGNVFCSRQTLFLYNGGVYNWVFIFSMNISSVHFNQQLLLTRSTRLHNEVSNHLTLGHQFSCLHQQSDCKLTGMDLHLCVGVLYFGCMWYISMFSVIVSTSAHFNRQLLLTRFTEPDIKVSSYLNLIHFSQNVVCGWSRLESDPITVQSTLEIHQTALFCQKSGMNRNQVANNVQAGGWWIKTNITSGSSASTFSKVFRCFHTLPFEYESEWQSFSEAHYLLWYGLDIPLQIFMSMDTPTWFYEWQKVKTCNKT